MGWNNNCKHEPNEEYKIYFPYLFFITFKPRDAYECHPDNKVLGANMGPIWDWQDPGGPHVGTMNFAIWVVHLAITGSGNAFHVFNTKAVPEPKESCQLAPNKYTLVKF